eukprot:3645200-Pleurochrysis_carterae.AAC.1
MVIAKALAGRIALSSAQTALPHSHGRDPSNDEITSVRTRLSPTSAGTLPTSSTDPSNRATDATGTAPVPPS